MDMPADDAISIEEDQRSAERLAEVSPKIGENGTIERLGPRECEHGGRSISTAARAPGTLQVVGFTRWNIAHKHGCQAANVDAQLQSRGRAKNVADSGFEQIL
jgi:hypothetical protein